MSIKGGDNKTDIETKMGWSKAKKIHWVCTRHIFEQQKIGESSACDKNILGATIVKLMIFGRKSWLKNY